MLKDENFQSVRLRIWFFCMFGLAKASGSHFCCFDCVYTEQSMGNPGFWPFVFKKKKKKRPLVSYKVLYLLLLTVSYICRLSAFSYTLQWNSWWTQPVSINSSPEHQQSTPYECECSPWWNGTRLQNKQ